MVETNWPDLHGKEVRFHDGMWRLTGDVDVRNRGESLAVEAYRTDDVRHETALLHFGIESSDDSLNPGNLGEHVDRLERTDRGQCLLVKRGLKTYRYELERLEYE